MQRDTDTTAPLSAEGIAARLASALRLLADGVAMTEGDSIGVLNARACAEMLVKQAADHVAAEARATQAEALLSDLCRLTGAESHAAAVSVVATMLHGADATAYGGVVRAYADERKARAQAEAERDAAQAALERDRTRVAEMVTGIRRAIASYSWLRDGSRGSYAYDDERYVEEFGRAITAIEVVVDRLAGIARDWTNCPPTQAKVDAARAVGRELADMKAALSASQAREAGLRALLTNAARCVRHLAESETDAEIYASATACEAEIDAALSAHPAQGADIAREVAASLCECRPLMEFAPERFYPRIERADAALAKARSAGLLTTETEGSNG
ncbi:hypothetical protein [Azospirillum argentinense]